MGFWENYLNKSEINVFTSPPLIALKAPSKVAKDTFLAWRAFTAVAPDAIKNEATITWKIPFATCLALAGFGVYFFSSKSNDNDNKGGKNKRVNSKKKTYGSNENNSGYTYSDSNSEIDSDNDSDSNSDSDSDSDSELHKEPLKKNKKQPNKKTQNNRAKFSSTRKKYY